MFRTTYKDTHMERVRLYVPCVDEPNLLENVYEHYTIRRYYWRGICVWEKEIDVERHPITDLIRRACGG